VNDGAADLPGRSQIICCSVVHTPQKALLVPNCQIKKCPASHKPLYSRDLRCLETGQKIHLVKPCPNCQGLRQQKVSKTRRYACFCPISGQSDFLGHFGFLYTLANSN
jgi:hypothetical protein